MLLIMLFLFRISSDLPNKILKVVQLNSSNKVGNNIIIIIISPSKSGNNNNNNNNNKNNIYTGWTF